MFHLLRTVLVAVLAALLMSIPGPGSAAETCGNGHLDAGENCSTCPGDCEIHQCTPTGKPHTFTVQFATAPETKVSSITVLVGYDSRRVSIPGSAGAESTRQRLRDVPKNTIIVTNDLDYGLRAVVTRPGGIESGQIFVVAVDACKGAAAPTVSDFGCIVEGCAAASGRIDGCTCRVTVR